MLQVDGNVSIESENAEYIPVHVGIRETQTLGRGVNKTNNHTIKRSNKALQALNLPSVANINPRSLYNKVEEFVTFVNETVQGGIELVFVSESFERPEFNLKELLEPFEEMEEYEIVSNPHQRTGMGGRPAIIVKKGKFHIENLTNTLLTIPCGVEAVWALLTPRNVTKSSKIQKIACCSFYLRPQSTAPQRANMLDHITESFHILSTKYTRGLEFHIAGDANKLRLDPILHLTPRMRSLVETPTRLGAPGSVPAMLDPILSTLGSYYQVPIVLPPLDPDPGSGGKKSDHMIPLMLPVNMVDNNVARTYRTITVRPLPQSGINKLIEWMIQQNWEEVTQLETTHEKAKAVQEKVVEKLDEFLPTKTIKIASDDKPWMTDKLKKFAKKKERIFWKERRSERWKILNKNFQKMVKDSKQSFYSDMVEELKVTNPGRWYSQLKRMCSYDEGKSEKLIVPDICHLSDQEQAEAIADRLQATSSTYKHLEDDDIQVPDIPPGSVPEVSPVKVREYIRKMKTKKSTVEGDIPAKIIKECANYLCLPLADIINTGIRRGEWSDIWKSELITPIPKCFPLKTMKDLRPIANLLSFNKIAEGLISEMIISDMKPKMDRSQFGNQKHTSIQHYLIKFLHRIQSSLDNNSKGETMAALVSLLDWEEAFSKQCHILGIESFIRNGVRPALVPMLINYFQNRRMKVKWHGKQSTSRNLPGGGAMGATFGILEYLSQTNNNIDSVPEEDRFKWVDDVSILEIISLISIGLCSLNTKPNVPSDLPEHGQ